MVDELVDLVSDRCGARGGAADPEDERADVSLEVEGVEAGSAFLEVELDLYPLRLR